MVGILVKVVCWVCLCVGKVGRQWATYLVLILMGGDVRVC